MTVEIVRAAAGFRDWDGLLRLLLAAFDYQNDRIDPPSSLHGFNAESIAAKAKAETLFVALDDGELVGCVFAKPQSASLYVGKLAVSPGRQRAGIGRRLMQAAEDFAGQIGLAALELDTRIELTENHETFAAMGFAQTGEHAHAGYDHPTFITMRKNLSGWRELSEPWQAAVTEAMVAYLKEGSAPIGAVVVNARGDIVARGRNGASANRLAHAEINALTSLPADVDRAECELYTTLEPCPMCTGAIRMSQLRAVHFAAYDPSAGSTAFLHANDFMRAFPCGVNTPTNAVLERAIVSLVIEYRERTQHRRWRDRWDAYHPQASARGARLAAAGAFAEWAALSLAPEQLYERLVASGAA
jgi:tRNA(Arg) A34 adenosine deaminase TadA/GNAT superfamily N-acetyltransferase